MSELTIFCLEGLLVPCFAATDQRIGLNVQFFFQSLRVFCSSIYIESALNSSEECDEFADFLF